MDIPDPQIVRLPRVKEKTGLGGTSIYRGVKEGWFPQPVVLVGRTVGWHLHEVDAWIEQRARVDPTRSLPTPHRGRPRKRPVQVPALDHTAGSAAVR